MQGVTLQSSCPYPLPLRGRVRACPELAEGVGVKTPAIQIPSPSCSSFNPVNPDSDSRNPNAILGQREYCHGEANVCYNGIYYIAAGTVGSGAVSGSGSVVEHLLAKEGVASSNLVFRSISLSHIRANLIIPRLATLCPRRREICDSWSKCTRGGTDHIENLQLLCPSCNRIKGDRPMEYLAAQLAGTGR